MSMSVTGAIRRLGPRISARVSRRALKEAVVERDPWYDTDAKCDDPGIFVLGCGRSGTTMLREILTRHSRLAGGPESTVLCDIVNPRRLGRLWNIDPAELQRRADQSDSVVDFASRLFRERASMDGKTRWVEKTPRNARVMHRLLQQFPNAKFIHIVRDGRDVVCSMRSFLTTDVRDGKIIERSKVHEFSVEDCARRWVRDVAAAHALLGHPRVTEVRYEDIVDNPLPAISRLCEFLGEAFEPAMLEESRRSSKDDPGRFVNNERAAEKIQTSRKARWRRDLSPNDRRVVHRIAGGLLIALGYAPDDAWVQDADAPG